MFRMRSLFKRFSRRRFISSEGIFSTSQNLANHRPNKAYIDQGKLLFEEDRNFERALSEGFFYVRMPAGLDMSCAKKLAFNFYKPKEENSDHIDNIYKGYHGKPHGMFISDLFQNGYIDRENNQVESLYLRPQDLEKFPNELVKISKIMNVYSVIVLKNILQRLNVPEVLWLEAAGECLKNNDFLLGFNHYRTEKEKQGAVAHKDSGWVTILYSESPGLNAHINNDWAPINPIPGYFTVNFGSLLDVFTKDCKPQPAVASLHRVARQYKVSPEEIDRFSIGLFLQPNQMHTKVYTYDPVTMSLNYLKTYQEFLDGLIKLYDSERENISSSYETNALAAKR